jgi:hypothetical protein
MAILKTAISIVFAGWIAAPAAQFPVRHEHLYKSCSGTMTADDSGIRFSGPNHSFTWSYDEIQQLRLEPGKLRILTYADSRLRLGADREYEFVGDLPVAGLYALWKRRMDERFVAEVSQPEVAGFSVPVKHLKPIRGSQGTLVFGADSILYSTSLRGDSRAWRYTDIDNISRSGPFQLTITTFEHASSQYGSRKGFNFELKQPITEARYNEIWLRIENKSGRIQ